MIVPVDEIRKAWLALGRQAFPGKTESELAAIGRALLPVTAALVLAVLEKKDGPSGPCRRCRREPCACPPLAIRTSGPWRGKGSFGKAPFGSQVGHRRR